MDIIKTCEIKLNNYLSENIKFSTPLNQHVKLSNLILNTA